MPELLLGVDAGGTKTRVLVAAKDGRLLASLQEGPANFQDIGMKALELRLRKIFRQLRPLCGPRLSKVKAACFGMAGADRPEDFAALTRLLKKLARAPKIKLVNDAALVLRQALPGGVGIALISGTGANSIGCGEGGKTLQVGGWSHRGGGGGQLGEMALRAAIESYDGRGPKTRLQALVQKAWNLKKMPDLLEYQYFDRPRGVPPRPADLAPLVFKAAGEGDKVARAIILHAAWELSRMAKVLAARLFPGKRELKVALGGTLLQTARPPLLREALKASIRRFRPKAEFFMASQEPVYGALAYAFDMERT